MPGLIKVRQGSVSINSRLNLTFLFEALLLRDWIGTPFCGRSFNAKGSFAG